MRTRIAILVLALALLGGCSRGKPARGPAPPDPLAAVPADDLFQRGVQFRRAGDFIRAEQYLAASRDRGYPEGKVIHELIGVCIDANRYQAALRYASPYLSRNPDDWTLRYLVGSLYLATGEAERARTELVRVTAQNPEAAEPYYLLALAYSERLDQPEQAAAAFEAYLARAPNGEHAAEARAWLDTAAEKKPAPQPAPTPTSPPEGEPTP